MQQHLVHSILRQIRHLGQTRVCTALNTCSNAGGSAVPGWALHPPQLAALHRALAQQAGDGSNSPAKKAHSASNTPHGAASTSNKPSDGPPAPPTATSAEAAAAPSALHSPAGLTPTAPQPSSAAASGGGLQAYVSTAMLTQISSTINRLTGYENIDHLKGSVGEADKQLQKCKRQLQVAKLEYEQQLATQSQLHREVTALLQRKSSWVPADVSRFTELYAAEHQTEAAVAVAKARYSALSDDAERLQLQLVDLIRERYQQEQVWSDKIRRASTWWTWGLMGLHFASFVAVYTFLEPRKRAALQAAVSDMLQQHTASLDGKLMQLMPAAAAAAAAADVYGGYGDAGDQAAALPIVQQQQQQQWKQQQRGSSRTQHQAADMQQQMLQELHLVREQLAHLQQAVGAGTAAAAAAAAAASNKQQQQQTSGRWQLPGGTWAVQQLSAAGKSARGLWQSTRQRAEQALVHYTSRKQEQQQQQQQQQQQASSGGSSPGQLEQQEGEANPAAAGGIVEQSSQTTQSMVQEQQQQQQRGQGEKVVAGAEAVKTSKPDPHGDAAPAVVKQEAGGAGKKQAGRAVSKAHAPAAEHQAAAQGNVRGLLQQWQGSSSVLEVTRGQLAMLAAGASAAGAGLAAVVVAVLRSSGGGASGSS